MSLSAASEPSASDEAYAAATDAMGRSYFGARWSTQRLENATDRKAARAAVDAFLAFNPSAANASPAAGHAPGHGRALPGRPGANLSEGSDR